MTSYPLSAVTTSEVDAALALNDLDSRLAWAEAGSATNSPGPGLSYPIAEYNCDSPDLSAAVNDLNARLLLVEAGSADPGSAFAYATSPVTSSFPDGLPAVADLDDRLADL